MVLARPLVLSTSVKIYIQAWLLYLTIDGLISSSFYVFARDIWYLRSKPDLLNLFLKVLIRIAFSTLWILLSPKRSSLFYPSDQKVYGLLEVGSFLNKRSITTSWIWSAKANLSCCCSLCVGFLLHLRLLVIILVFKLKPYEGIRM